MICLIQPHALSIIPLVAKQKMKRAVGIVGMPNVGKSTLFNALTKTQVAEAANYPFCTIEPNVARVSIPNKELQVIAGINNCVGRSSQALSYLVVFML